ncbi:hypothetical protein CLAFUW4_10812 [Fulvia fulva]|nr:hypothetical protein CLAFUR4_10817 [Fulvia fulva]KAK4620916.1 hypothetical protein CLAFUR0_10824 [Fulvia fulva]WPV17211.1 hypothetical protein CLAFUW4_10812 [Fulvia fulva]WPV31917.1 hypothetical protein CLAFUW7_10810 [Fulvia fulva]
MLNVWASWLGTKGYFPPQGHSKPNRPNHITTSSLTNTPNHRPNKSKTHLTMGNKLSTEQKTNIIAEARKLVKSGRDSFPLPEPQPSHASYLEGRAYPLLADLETQLGKKNPDFEKMQDKCEQMAGVLASPDLKTFYEVPFASDPAVKARARGN